MVYLFFQDETLLEETLRISHMEKEEASLIRWLIVLCYTTSVAIEDTSSFHTHFSSSLDLSRKFEL